MEHTDVNSTSVAPDQENTQDAPIANPSHDMDFAEDEDEDVADASDDESLLSDIDEAQFEDFDPAAVAIEDRPVAVDENNIGLLGVHKRKRIDSADREERKRKKEGKRERSKRSRKPASDEENLSGAEAIDGKRVRKPKDSTEKRERPRLRKATPEDEESLTPEERRKRALDRAMDQALKGPNRRRRKLDGIDLEAQNDELIENMRRRMTEAAKADTDARQLGKPAMQKLKMLPEVLALLNRNNLRHQLVDPDINLLEAVRFFLEPLNDGSLPAFNIQRDLLSALSQLPINKDALVASGIGKVTMFYTKSQKPQPGIKRMASKLVSEWTRPIIKRSDDYGKREFVEAIYDPQTLPVRDALNATSGQAAAVAAARERKLAAPIKSNRARIEGGISSYSIVPKSQIGTTQFTRPMGASGEDAFRRMKARQANKAAGSSRR